MFNCVNDLFLQDVVKQPTRFRQGNLPSALDWVLVEEPDIIENLRIDAPFGKSDHATICFDIRCNVMYNNNQVKLNYYKGDYEQFSKDLEDMNLAEHMVNMNTQEAWDLLQSRLEGLIERYIPKKRYLSKKKAPWLSLTATKA